MLLAGRRGSSQRGRGTFGAAQKYPKSRLGVPPLSTPGFGSNARGEGLPDRLNRKREYLRTPAFVQVRLPACEKDSPELGEQLLLKIACCLWCGGDLGAGAGSKLGPAENQRSVFRGERRRSGASAFPPTGGNEGCATCADATRQRRARSEGIPPPTAAAAPSAAEGAGPGAGTVLFTAKAAEPSVAWPYSPCLPVGYLGA